MSKYVVTGGAGFIGSHVVEHLLSRNRSDTVTVIDDLSTGKLSNFEFFRDPEIYDRVSFEGIDITKSPRLRTLIQGAERCFHLAALNSIPLSMNIPVRVSEVNVMGFLHVLLACRDEKVPLSFASSASANYPYNSVYGATKRANEHYAESLYPGSAIALRPSNVYGPRQRVGAVIPTWFSTWPNIEVHGDASRRFTYVTDVARAFVEATESCDLVPEGHAETTLTELARAMSSVIGSNCNLVAVGSRVKFLARPQPPENPIRGEVWTSLADGLSRVHHRAR